MLTDTVYLPELLGLPSFCQSSLDGSGGALGLAELFGSDSRVGGDNWRRSGTRGQASILHDCGHIGTEAINGLITGDGVGMADQVLREAIVMNRSNGMYVTEKSEAVSGFSRAIGELVQAWPSAQQVS